MLLLQENMKYYRKLLHLTQQDIADMLNVDRTTYTSYETHRVPSLDILIKLAKIFNVTLDQLAGLSAPLVVEEDKDTFYKNNDIFNKHLSHDERMLLFSLRLLTPEQQKDVSDLVYKYVKDI